MSSCHLGFIFCHKKDINLIHCLTNIAGMFVYTYVSNNLAMKFADSTRLSPELFAVRRGLEVAIFSRDQGRGAPVCNLSRSVTELSDHQG